MGSDHPPPLLLQAASSLLPSLPQNVELIAIGAPEYAKDSPLSYHPAKESIRADENPGLALRRKKETSLSVGLKLLKEGAIDAFVSAGNTGALVTASKRILGLFPGLRRPALLALMPTKKRPVAVLDVGANLHLKASYLIQFAHLGIAYQEARGIERPRLGMLNIGSEASKGTSELQTAYRALQKIDTFAGNIEGTSVFNGEVDVLVTDGFTGNIFLKTAEGIASLILDRIQTTLPSSVLQEIAPHLNDLQRHLHYAEHPGALLCGVLGTVVKCHGYASPEAFAHSIRGAIEFSLSGFTHRLESKLRELRSRV